MYSTYTEVINMMSALYWWFDPGQFNLFHYGQLMLVVQVSDKCLPQCTRGKSATADYNPWFNQFMMSQSY